MIGRKSSPLLPKKKKTALKGRGSARPKKTPAYEEDEEIPDRPVRQPKEKKPKRRRGVEPSAPQQQLSTEDKKQMLDETLRLLLDMADNPPTVRITHFIPDPRKAGGAYVTVTGQITDADPLAGCVVLADKRRIPIGDILDIEM